MARDITVTFEDGTSHVYRGAPDDVTPDQVSARASQEFSKRVAALDGGRGGDAPANTPPQQSFIDTVKQAAGNLTAGAVRGAGSIGATILAPYDIAKDAIAGKGLSLESNRQRRADMDYGLEAMGAQPDSIAYKGGKLAAEIAGTAGTAGVLAKGAQAAGVSPSVVAALQSGGFSLGRPGATTAAGRLGDLALRVGAGSAVGGASAGMVDPEQAGTGAIIGGAMPAAVKAAGMIGKGIRATTKHALGASTGTSAETISAAFNAGKKGQTAFLDNMRGNAAFDDVVDSAKAGLEKMRIDRGNQYRRGMVDISKDKSVLDFAPVDKVVSQIRDMGSYKGVQTNKHAADIVDEISAKVAEWKALNPAEYHTPEGFDALKRAIGDIRDSTQFGTASRKAADSVYNAVKGEISAQAPTYNKVMSDYAAASEELKQIEKALSLGDKASKDTAIRKLQSLMRNNAQSNYGNRLSLAAELETKGGVELTPAIAGQAMNSMMPRGLGGAIQKAGWTALGGASVVNPALLPALALAPATSPRLVGEALYKVGRASGAAGNGLNSAYGLLLNRSANPQLPLGLLSAVPAVTLSSQASQR